MSRRYSVQASDRETCIELGYPGWGEGRDEVTTHLHQDQQGFETRSVKGEETINRSQRPCLNTLTCLYLYLRYLR